MTTCSKENLHLCGHPPLSFTRESMCEEGSFSVILAISFFAIVFMFFQAIHRWGNTNANKGIVVGSGSLANKLENIFIKPFVPTSIEVFIVLYSVCWFLMTIQMALTRYYDGRWALEMLAQQGPFNFLLSRVPGCNGINITSAVYTHSLDEPHHQAKERNLASIMRRKPVVDDDAEAQQTHFEMIDLFFTLHLTFGLIWLISGGLQIWLAEHGWSSDKDARHRAHRKFGKCVAVPAMFCHIFMAIAMVVKNPVRQSIFIQIMYLSFIVTGFTRPLKGLKYAREARALGEGSPERNMTLGRHKVAMARNYVWTTFGSGAIRLTSWVLWVIGKFFPFETRILIDRGECQTYAPFLGSEFVGLADHCMQPVFYNLVLTMMLQSWIDWIFLCILEKNGEAHPDDKQDIKSNLRLLIQLLGMNMPLYFLFPDHGEIILKTTIIVTAIANTSLFRELTVDITRKEEPLLDHGNVIRKALVVVCGEHGMHPHHE